MMPEARIQLGSTLTHTRKRIWHKCHADGMIRIKSAEWLCVCGKWHLLKVGGAVGASEKPLCIEDRVLNAMRRARMTGCPRGRTRAEDKMGGDS